MSKRAGGSKSKRGRGSIYKQPGCNTYSIQYFRNARRVREATGFEDLQAAQQLLTRRLAQCDQGEMIEPSRKNRALVAELWEGLEADYKINGRKSSIKKRWKHLGPFFGDLSAVSVSHDTLQRYILQRLDEKAKNATINRELAALKRAFNLGRRNQKVRLMPVFPKLTENNTRVGFIEDADYEKLIASCSELWLRLFVEIAYSFAWRKGEILKLRVRHVSLAARTIRLDPGSTKNGNGREVSMTTPIYLLAAQAVAGKAKDDFLLTREKKRPVRSIRDAWQALCVSTGLGSLVCKGRDDQPCGSPFVVKKCECGILKRRSKKCDCNKCTECGGSEYRYSGLLIHDLRRSGARQLRRAGVSEGVVKEIGGWETDSMFKRYAIVSNADTRIAMARLERARAEDRLLLQKREADSHDRSHDLGETSMGSDPAETDKVN